MARNSYGNTYWGEQWLNALTKIDNSNRLPRGKSYANKGSVKSIEINRNIIEAKVQGSMPRPYKVTIDIPLFSGEQQGRVLSIIEENPVFLSALLNRALPVELNEACQQQNVEIFPRSWRSFGMKCSCPDSAVPCKHLAAVLYIVANEIDKNPFMVFEMHGFDLLKALEKSGFASSEAKREHIVSVTDFCESKDDKSTVIHNPTLYSTLDFSTIPNLVETLPSILSTKPVFYPQGDFKEIYKTNLKRIAKESRRTLTLGAINESEQYSHQFEAVEDISLKIDADFDLKEVIFRGAEENIFTTKNIRKLREWLATIPTAGVSNFSPKLVAFHTAYKLSLKLVAEGAIVPQLLVTDKKRYAVRWLPALLNEQVKVQYDILAQLTPPDMVSFIQGKKEIKANLSENSLSLISLFINDLVHENSSVSAKSNSVDDIFFTPQTAIFDSFQEKEIPNSIQLWSNRFYLTERNFIPLLKVSDIDGGFEVSLFIENKRDKIADPIALSDVFSKNEYKGIRLDALKSLSLLTEHFPQLQKLIARKGAEPLQFDSQSFVTVFFEILPIMRLLGIRVMLPKALNKIFKPQISMQMMTESVRVDYGTSVLNMEDLLRFNWKIALGSNHVKPEDFLKMVKGMSGIVQIQGEYVFLDDKEINAVLKKLENPPALSTIDLLQIALVEEYDGTPIEITKEVRELMDFLMSGQGLELPNNLQAQLRPYQLRGYEWLYKNARLGFGSIIADDMGLGKTLQVITTLLKFKEDKTINDKNKALVVLPTSLLTNWQKEITRFAPDLEAVVYHGSSRKWDTKGKDIILTTYGVIRSETAVFSKEKWSIMVIDEAQNIKNPNTSQSKAVKKINATVKIAMSGTPVENRLSEYWSIFDFSNKGYLKNLNTFKSDFAFPIEVEKDQSVLRKFRKVTAPFILRRLKSDKTIIKDLPDKIEMNQYCTLTSEQTALYQNVVAKYLPNVEDPTQTPVARQGAILSLLTALKQVCNHPTQFAKKGDADPSLSGKSLFLFDLLENILETDEKVLIFTQYAQMGELLASMIKTSFGINAPFLHGGLSRDKRDEMVENFQTKPNTRILILSLKAGGTGLNLTAANHVVHYDLWWNPAVEAQATDRAYRIGQQRNVNVHRFISQGTMEEKIDKLIQSKKDLADMSVTTGESWLGDLSNKELKALVAL
jgi:SNF2 family DNA or RNA helicase/uncharacterized Zn finger protein